MMNIDVLIRQEFHPMMPSRRRFLQNTLLGLPALGSLSACGGGGGGGGTGSATSSLSSTCLSPASLAVPLSSTPLSGGIQGTQLVAYSPLAKPTTLGQPVTDPDFGTRIVRVSDAVGLFQCTNCVTAYSSTQAWNCDETYMILYVQGPLVSGVPSTWALFNGMPPYNFIKFLPNFAPSDVEQFWWSQTDPKAVLYISNYAEGTTNYCQMVSYDVDTGNKTVLYDFVPMLKALGWPTTGPVRAGYPLANGGNNVIWGLGAGGIPNIDGYLALNAFGFNLQTQQVVLYSGIATAEPRSACPAPLLSGKGWFWNDTNFSSASQYESWVLDNCGNVVRKVPFSASEHVDTCMNMAGDDLLVGVQFDTAKPGNIIRANLSTGAIDTIVGQANGYGYTRTGSFAGSTCYKNRPWVVGSAVGSPYGTNPDLTPASSPTLKTQLDQEVFLSNMEDGSTFRLAHHRSTGYWTNAPTNNYWAQPNVTISPSGTRILFNSDWGNADPSNPSINPAANTDTYVIELPQFAG